jgi:fructokinase
MADRLIGGVEGGGTKFLAAVARQSGSDRPEIVDQIRVETTDSPADTLMPLAEWLGNHSLDGLGIATFGPLDLATGKVGTTPKEGWSGADVSGALTARFDDPPPTGFDTDVNGAGLAEWRWGAAHGTSVSLYITVGTGIGGGAIVDGSPVHGLSHPEMGHISVPQHPDESLASLCPHHDSCLEGMASGPAMAARAGQPSEELGSDDKSWDLAVHYLAHGLADLTLVLSPEIIVMGGGVMQQAGLLERVATRLDEVLGGYAVTPRVAPAALGQEAGLYGALALA